MNWQTCEFRCSLYRTKALLVQRIGDLCQRLPFLFELLNACNQLAIVACLIVSLDRSAVCDVANEATGEADFDVHVFAFTVDRNDIAVDEYLVRRRRRLTDSDADQHREACGKGEHYQQYGFPFHRGATRDLLNQQAGRWGRPIFLPQAASPIKISANRARCQVASPHSI